MDAEIAGNHLSNMMAGSGSPIQKVLEPGQTYSVSCGEEKSTFVNAPESLVSSMTVEAVAIYRPWPFTFFRSRRFFKFLGTNNGAKLNWYKEPPTDSDERRFDEFIKSFHVPFP